MIKIISKLILKLSGWTISDQTPKGIINYHKAVIIGAPHTSNWDYVYAMAAIYRVGLNIKYLAKDSLFKFPLGILIKALGGIPVNRSQKNNLVGMMVNILKDSETDIHIIVPVEGTRSYTKEWKSGFYHIAMQANVPIILGFMDFKTKTVGFMDVFVPTGDYQSDLILIQKKYVNITPKYPELSSIKDLKLD
ncbi:1-acyl-sn-glycerol-3-phosphate acyltransferase [Arcicella rigui]|uniref:1-acyl-sn-glycerol-3-phosphate acyltransferase n=1 Tax=Arcicella rigui TaxID=797020 RepID=A0ABU5Q5R9_9BACT|nr:1-acyl-sn-glycerol-3-phosphate acyltransferase [Arcicella rigui]MEA5138160.1 1-acyl-sn-glycerol-3-phosphate acyltransferase [Arcicella rigui]